MSKRIERNKLEIQENTKILSLSIRQDYVVKMDKGDDIDVHWVDDLDNAPIIVNELNEYLCGQRGKRGICNIILRYIRYVVAVQGCISIVSLKDYRQVLNENKDITVRTKGQYFSAIRAFIKHLMDSDVLSHDDFPNSFKYGKSKPKANFVDVCRYELEDILQNNNVEVELLENNYKLDKLEAQALFFSSRSMDQLRSFAESEVEKIIADWDYFDGIIGDLSDEKIEVYKNCENFNDCKDKSIETALSILYAKYGRVLPAGEKWPNGIVDFCKKKKNGWITSRIRNVFFPTSKSLEVFGAITLCDSDLMPDVDCIFQYAYTNCCMPSSEKGMVDVHLGKMRGSPITATLKKTLPVVVALKKLSERIVKLLEEIPEARAYLVQEFTSIMLHCTASGGAVELSIRNLDVSTTTNIVRRFIKNAAVVYPDLQPLVGKITGENFRPTHVYIRRLSGQSYGQIKTALHHKHMSTTEGYVEGIETESIVNRKYLKFQQYLVDEAKEHAHKKTGSGYLCNDKSAENDSCTNFNDCFTCDAKRIVFEDVEIVAEWIAWEKIIIENKERLSLNNPERWNIYWKQKLIEYQSLISLTKERLLQKAKIISENIVLPPLD